LVSDEDAMSANMERILQMSQQEVQKSQRIMEINPDHKICQFLQSELDEGKDTNDWFDVLYDQALLAEGSPVERPGEFVKKLNLLLTKSLG
jgi:molecular chaperone HtpG